MKKAILPLIRTFISVFFIALLLYIMRDKYPQIIEVLAKTRITVFAAGFLIFLAACAAASARLRIIIEAQDIPVTFKESFSLTFIGYFFNNFLPTAIGGDVVKAYYLSRKTDNKAGSYASVFVDRVIGLITMILMAFIALFFVEEGIVDNTVRMIVYFITVGSIIAIAFMTNKSLAKKFSFLFFLIRPLEAKLKKLYVIIHKYQYRKTLMLKSFAISFLSQIFFFLSMYALAFSIGAHLPLKDLFIKMPVISMMSLLPSINGLGLREGSTVVLFGSTIGQDKAFALSILWLMVLLCVSVIGGIVYSLSPQFRVKLKEVEEAGV